MLKSWSYLADTELFRLPDCTHWYTSCHLGELEPSGLQSQCQALAVLQYLVPVAEPLLIINNFFMAHYQSFWRARAAEPMSGSGCFKVQYLVPVHRREHRWSVYRRSVVTRDGRTFLQCIHVSRAKSSILPSHSAFLCKKKKNFQRLHSFACTFQILLCVPVSCSSVDNIFEFLKLKHVPKN